MKNARGVVMDTTDLKTWLHSLASGLRNSGLALEGRASAESSPGTKEHRDLYELSHSLGRVAAMLEAVAPRLCQKCKMMDVTVRVSFGITSPAP